MKSLLKIGGRERNQRTGKASRDCCSSVEGQCSDEPAHYPGSPSAAAAGFMQKLSAKIKLTVRPPGVSSLSSPEYYIQAKGVLGG